MIVPSPATGFDGALHPFFSVLTIDLMISAFMHEECENLILWNQNLQIVAAYIWLHVSPSKNLLALAVIVFFHND